MIGKTIAQSKSVRNRYGVTEGGLERKCCRSSSMGRCSQVNRKAGLCLVVACGLRVCKAVCGGCPVESLLSSCRSYGFSFVGFGAEPTGKLALDEFQIQYAG